MATQMDPDGNSSFCAAHEVSFTEILFFVCVTSHLLFENAFITPHCTQKQSCFSDTNVQKQCCVSLLCAGEALKMRRAPVAL